MYYEKLALEVGATVAGFTVLKPPVIKGASGNDQKFTFVAVDRNQTYAFDVCAEAGRKEILRSYIKKMDTGAKTFVVCLSGKPKLDATELAGYYGIEVLGPKEVGDFFSERIARQVSSVRLSKLEA